MTVSVYSRKSKLTQLKSFDYLADEYDTIEVTEWHNGEGVDVLIERNKGTDLIFSLTYGEAEALQYLILHRG